MGIIAGLQDEAERVQRRADQQVSLGNRRVTKQNAQATTLKGELAPLEEIIKHYNTGVENYNAGWFGGSGARYVTEGDNLFSVDANGQYFAAQRPSVVSGMYATTNGINGDGADAFSYNKYPTPNTAAATAADNALKSRQGDIDTLNASGKSIERRNGLMAQRAEREGERLNTSVEMNQRAIAEERQPQQQASAFDETKVFQSISDWLK